MTTSKNIDMTYLVNETLHDESLRFGERGATRPTVNGQRFFAKLSLSDIHAHIIMDKTKFTNNIA